MDVQKLFQQFNMKYFGARLPNYRVTKSDLYGSLGICRKKRREIHLRSDLQGSALLRQLLHEMAHAATNGRHGAVWQREMERLIRRGAPLKRELGVYRKNTVDLSGLIAEMEDAGFELGDRRQWPSVRKDEGYSNGLIDKHGKVESPAAAKTVQRLKLAFLAGVKEKQYLNKFRRPRGR